HDFDFAEGEPSFDLVSSLIAQKRDIKLCANIDARDASSNKLGVRLKKLQRIERFIFEERGAKDLYVGWPFIHGKLSDGTQIRSPLMFFPIGIDQRKNDWVLNLRRDVNLTLNKTFLLAYAHFNNVKLDEDLVERVFDDFDKEAKVFRTELYDLIKESSLEINFNQDLFADRLERFKTFKKTEFDKVHQEGSLKLMPEAVLGIFPQAGSYLVPDYVKLIEQSDLTSLDEFFTSRTIDKDEVDLSRHSEAYRFLDKVKEEQTFTPFKLDAYQENAIKAIKKGNSVVVQGPPGTGKSQLICNLISDYIARGKSILLVCQKKAALDVVFDRLKEIGMDQFVGLMHDFKNDRKNIYEQLADQIDRIQDYENRNNSLDTIHLERQFLKISREIDRLNEELEEFRFALFDESECGKSVKELYLSSDPHIDSINVKQYYKDLTYDKVDAFKSRLRQYTNYGKRFLNPEYVLRNRKSFAAFGVHEFNEIKRCLNEIPGYGQGISNRTVELTNQTVTLEEAGQVLEKKPKVEELLAILKDKTVYQYFRHIVEVDITPDPLWISNMERLVMQCYKGVGPESSLPKEELGRFQEVLERAIKTRKSVFKWFYWRLFSKDKVFITRVLVANGLKNSSKDSFNMLIEKVDNRLNLEHNLSKIKGQKWLQDFPSNYRKIEVQNWFYFQKQAVSAALIFASLRSLKSFLPVNRMFYEELRDRFTQLLEIYETIPEKMSDWTRFLTSNQIHTIATSPEQTDQMQKALKQDFDSLCEFDKLKEEFSSSELELIDRLVDQSENVDSDEIQTLLDNSVALAWIDHVETKYPVLRSVSSQKLVEQERTLQEAVIEKMKISNEILLMKARERTYRDIEFNRLNNRVTYRDLYHQVTKKRRIWPVRKLIKNYPDEVFSLIPCWMASPESASAIFQMEEIFDLVIFDEASQCFAEKGIPAMYRGKQVVITGDDKQLMPNDLYKVRWEDDNDEDIPELEIDSLLNLANQYLMQLFLKGHYRSKSLELIEFSNQHFYKGNLMLLPDHQEINDKEQPIQYIKVNGLWEDNTNLKEAQKIRDLILKYIEDEPSKSMGVVTFNAKQQGLILDLLDQAALEDDVILPESLFVKNIENVQGDEKDIIIFSIGYAPDEEGKFNMKFGSLNVTGGENRLNVAVTRAREQVVVVTSIKPNQLSIEHTKNEGPKLLKQYLEYAYKVSKGKLNFEQFAPTSIPEWHLSAKLSQLSLDSFGQVNMTRELPFADLTVKVNDAYQGL
ncbi:MAG: AAA domain-containing protein, partial [Bacteroidota bacterium]